MRIIHIVPVFQKVSGVSTFAGEVANAQSAAGNVVMIATLQQYVSDHYPVLGQVRIIDIAQVHEFLDAPQVIVHIHGIWTPILHHVVACAAQKEIPIVWSPHGMLAPWAMRHKGWKKWPVWWLWQKRDLAKAALIHVTTELEAEWVRGLGLRNNIVVVPLGTAIPIKLRGMRTREKIVLFVGRIYPVKGLVNLVNAWALLTGGAGRNETGHEFDQWKLRIVGPDEAGHKAELEQLIATKGLRGRVEFPGPLFGEALVQEYDRCECLVLPSFTENFGATVLDALAHGKPCIASTFTPWRELPERGCGWWVSNDPAELANTIRVMINVGDEERRKMGERGRRLVEKKYSWPSVAAQMMKGYESVIKRSSD